MQLNQRPLGLETLNGTGVTFAGSVSAPTTSDSTVKGTRLAVSTSPLVIGSGMSGSGGRIVSSAQSLASLCGLQSPGIRLAIGSAAYLAGSGLFAVSGRYFAADTTTLACLSDLTASARRTVLTTGFFDSKADALTTPILRIVGIGQFPVSTGLASPGVRLKVAGATLSSQGGFAAPAIRLAVSRGAFQAEVGFPTSPLRVVLPSSEVATRTVLSATGFRVLLPDAEMQSLVAFPTQALVTRGSLAGIVSDGKVLCIPFLEVGGLANAVSLADFISGFGVVTHDGLPVIHMATLAETGAIVFSDTRINTGVVNFLSGRAFSLIPFDE